MKNLFLLLFCSLIYNPAHAGDLQGGGGGPQNISIKQFLDKRVYALDGGGKELVPRINIVNACRFENSINTIKKVWACSGAGRSVNSYSNICGQKTKMHLSFDIPEPTGKCLTYKAKVLPNIGLKEVCVAEDTSKLVSFPMTYKMDVYRISVGNGGTPLRPNLDRDQFVKTIKYKIPNCLDVTN